MRAIAITFIAALLAAPAVAQPPASPAQGHDASASQTLNPTLANGAPPVPEQAQTGEAKPASVTTAATTMPKTWTGNPEQWDAHAKACAKRHRNYDAATDTYRGLFGTRTCTTASLATGR